MMYPFLLVRERNGYAEFFDVRQRRWVLTHRRAIENLLGRPIPRGHHVHHIDRDKRNNRHGNLVALPPAVHQRLHHGDFRACFRCGRSGHWAANCYAYCDITGRRIACRP